MVTTTTMVTKSQKNYFVIFAIFGPFVVSARDVQCRAAMATDGRQSLGKMGENLACVELARRGYAILERRYRTRYGEIDIIARSGRTLVFVEVKARAGDKYGGGGAAVTPCKQQRIVRMATDFLARRHLLDEPCRFDVVTVDFEGGHPRIEVYPHAFTA
jgi:putative endonuclease